MILTCPSCTMRYLVAEGAIGPDGREVRCANCGHEWWQEGEEGLDEALFGPAEEEPEQEQEPDLEEELHEQVFVDVPEEIPGEDSFNSILQKEIETVSIPEGVKPVYDDSILPALPTKTTKLPPQRIGGFLTALLFWTGIAALLLFFQPQISRAWPPSNLVYNLVGLKPVLPGEGLTLGDLEAKFTDGKIVMTGDIINLKDKTVKVPAILATISRDDEEILDRVLIAPPQDKLKQQERVSFDVVYPSIPEGAVNVNFAFTFLKAEKPKGEKAAEPEKANDKHAEETTPVEKEKASHEEPAHSKEPSAH